MWPFKKKPEPIEKEEAPERPSYFSTDSARIPLSKLINNAMNMTFQRSAKDHVAADMAMDDISDVKSAMRENFGGIPMAQLSWYGSQGFIGYQACALIAQHWLVSKACTIPARDAIRKGYEITVNDGKEVSPDILDKIRTLDKKYRLDQNLVEFVKMGRTFGIRIAMFKVESTDKEYYSKPYNPDGITPGSYKGISQIDPYWIAPQLDQESASDPSAISFYEPTWWTIGGKKIHKSHLIIMRGDEVPDILKPTYLYGGVSVPQKIYERVYAADRTANEAPQLVLTKRTNVWQTDLSKFYANKDQAESKMQDWAYFRDNYGIKIGDKVEDQFSQFDTSLGDLDAVIMTQYQLVASVANVPATKLLGVQPKGFNATGEYEEASYREELESIQSFDLAPLIDRHHEILIRSEIRPAEMFTTSVQFKPLDSLTEIEQADVNLKKAQTHQVYQATGAVDGYDIREAIINDPKSGYNGLSMEEEDNGESDLDQEEI
jgi:phage-related protein (TIGR01555 family)